MHLYGLIGKSSKFLLGKNLQQADRYQQVGREIVQLLSRLHNNESRIYYVNYCAQQLSQGNTPLVPIIAKDLLKQLNRPQKKANQKFQQSSEKLPKQVAEEWEEPSEAQVGDRPENNRTPETALTDPSANTLLKEAEARLLRIYLHCPEYRENIIDALEDRDLDFTLSHHRLLWQQIAQVRESGKFFIGNQLKSRSVNLKTTR